jgi:cobalt/nickel transport system permease protein
MKTLLLVTILLAAAPARAMHISEGILPLDWALIWFAVAAPFVIAGVRRLNRLGHDDLAMKPLVGLLAAVVFIISCMPVPVPTAGTCSHPCGTAISAILVGPAVSVVISTVALLIQALVMAHGGLSTLGADIISMGVVGSFASWSVFRLLRLAGLGLGPAAFVAGVLTDWATYGATSLELAAGIRGGEPFWPLATKIAAAFVPTQLPLGLLEGAMTAGMVTLLARKRPDLLIKMNVLPSTEGSQRA